MNLKKHQVFSLNTNGTLEILGLPYFMLENTYLIHH